MIHRPLGATGLRLSVLGFGASPFGDVFGPTDPADDATAVAAAIDAGINFFDVSPYYGLTLAETRLGNALRGHRDHVVLATKCGRYGADEFDFSADRITRGLEDSLRRLHTDHVDLLQAHDIEFAPADRIVDETLPTLRRLQQQGKARFIGITGYSLANLLAVARRAPVDTLLSYCRYNLLIDDLVHTPNPDRNPDRNPDPNPDRNTDTNTGRKTGPSRDLPPSQVPAAANANDTTPLLAFIEQQGIGLINASPLHMGILSGREVPPWHPAPEAVRRAGDAIVALCGERALDPSAIALAFACAYPAITSTLVGMANQRDVHANVAALQAPPDTELLHRIRALAGPAFNTTWRSGLPENQG